jgi:membrane-associated protease RseP (regulator of RpoE activity)
MALPTVVYMQVIFRSGLFVVAAIWLGGCTTMNSLHYNWAYTPLHDAGSGAFQKPAGDIEYRELDSVEAMAEAESEMYRQGYVMIGYSNMFSPQLEMVAPNGARGLGKKYGASVVLNTFADRHYLATLWARPKHFVFGAYFTDELPDDARAALKDILDTEQAVIVQTVVLQSPAFDAGLRPGDLLFSVNGEPVADRAAMSAVLQQNAGREITLGVWSMEEGAPRTVTVALD